MTFISSCLKKLFIFSIYVVALFLFLVYAPFLLDISPQSYNIELNRSFSGPLEENDLLSKAEHLFKGEIKGPESIVHLNGDLYTALSDGRLIRIRGKKYTLVADLNEGKCEGHWEQWKCGCPLGMRSDSKGRLYIIDAYFGLKRVDLSGGKASVTTIFRPETKLGGTESVFLNDITIHEGAGRNGGNVYYMTRPTTKWPLDTAFYSIIEHEKSGRIIKYDEDINEVSVIASGLALANGIQITDSNDALIVAELSTRRIMKYYLKGSKAGKIEPLIENLPGEPDNIRRSSDTKKETYWVALITSRNSSHPHILDILSNRPLIRKALARLIYLIGNTLQYLGTISEYIPLKEIGHKIKSNQFTSYLKTRGLIIEFDSKGNIIRGLHSPDGKTSSLSEVCEVIEGDKKVLYIGSFNNDYIARLPLII